jgi:hypothetical protein
MAVSMTSGTDAPEAHGRAFTVVEQTPLAFLPSLACAALALAVSFISDPETVLLLIGFITIGWTIFTLQRRTGPYLVPSSVFVAAAGVFIGIACLYLSNRTDMADPDAVASAAVVALVLVIITEVVATLITMRWGLLWRVPAASDTRQFIPPRNYLVKGALLVILARSPLITARGNEFSWAIGLAGVLMISLTASAFRLRIRWGGDLLLAASAFIIPLGWAYLTFKSGGRLVLAGMAIAVLSGWNLVRPRRWHKTIVLIGIPGFLVFSGINRLQHIEREYGVQNQSTVATILGDGEGLASVYEPLTLFSKIISTTDHPGGKMEWRYGATYVNTLVMPIPRDWWEGKPKGFGAELTELLSPHLVHKGQSHAALLHSEFYANFGWPGLVMMPPVTGLVLAWLDRVHNRLAASRLSTARDWWQAATLLCVVASIGDLLWVGTFTFYSRGGLAAVVVFLVGAFSRGRRLAPARSVEPVVTRIDGLVDLSPGGSAALGAHPRATPSSTAR